MKKRRITVYIYESQVDALKRLARREDRSVSSYIRSLIERAARKGHVQR